MGCPRLTLKSRIKFAEEGGAAGITAVGVGEHQHVLQELEQGLDLLAFLDIIQPDYQLLQSLLLLFLFAALTGATGHVAAGGDCGKLGNLLLSELSCSTASAAGPALGHGRAQTATATAPAQPQPGLPSRIAPLGTPPGKSESRQPTAKNSNGALGKKDTAQLAPFRKAVSYKSSPYRERSNFLPKECSV